MGDVDRLIELAEENNRLFREVLSALVPQETGFPAPFGDDYVSGAVEMPVHLSKSPELAVITGGADPHCRNDLNCYDEGA